LPLLTFTLPFKLMRNWLLICVIGFLFAWLASYLRDWLLICVIGFLFA